MAIGYTPQTWANGAAPPLSAANLQTMDNGINAACDLLDNPTALAACLPDATASVPGKATAAQITKLGGIEALADVTDEANVTAIAVATAEVTAAPAHWWVLVGGALKRMTQAGWTALVLAATGKSNLATGFTLAGGTTPKTLTVSDDADTANIAQATTALRGTAEIATAAELVTGTDDTRVPSVKQLKDATGLADFFLTRRTKMPDGATAVYSQDAWATTDSWVSDYSPAPSVSGGVLTFKGDIFKIIAGSNSKLVVARIRCISGDTTIKIFSGVSVGSAPSITLKSNIWSVVSAQLLQAATNHVLILSPDASYIFELDFIWIGDYSYLPGSLSEEAARIANQIGDTAGVGAAATATITSNGTNVNTPAFGTLTTTTGLPAADSTFKVGTKTYTWKSALTPTEGEVLLEATVAACLTNARDAVNGTAGTLGTKHQCTANSLFTATASATILTVTAILRGTVGNGATYEIVAGAGSELTASGALATGGVDDTVTIGGKVYTFVGQTPTVEGQVRVEVTYIDTLSMFVRAINRTNPGIYDGVNYKIAAANPLVYATQLGAPIVITAGRANGSSYTGALATTAPGILGNQITIAKSAATLTLANPAGGTTTLAGGVDDAGAKAKAQLGPAIGAGATPGAMPTRTSTSIIGYRGVADCASGAQVTLPAGGTWMFRVATYGATYNSVMAGTAAGGLMSGTASANLRMFYERIA